MNIRLETMLMWVILLFMLFNSYPSAADAVALHIGQHTQNSQFPLHGIDTSEEGFRLVIDRHTTSSVFPSKSRKGENLAQLPDIVPVYAGFYDNDLADYVDKDLLEPLDSFFTDLGLDPKAIIPKTLLPAVTYKGHIWALPHRMNCFVMSYAEQVAARLGISRDVDSLKTAMDIVERVSKEAFPDSQEWSIYADISDDWQVAFCLWISRALSSDGTTVATISRLLLDYIGRGAFNPDAGSTPADAGNFAFFLELAQDVYTSPGRRVLLIPDKIMPDESDSNPNLLFLESFALKKNDPDRLEAGRHFLTWLLDVETQMTLIRKNVQTLPYKHIPVLTPILQHDRFQEIFGMLPDIADLIKLLETGSATDADPRSFRAQREAIAQRSKDALNLWGLTRYIHLMQPLTVVPLPEQPETTLESSFDAY